MKPKRRILSLLLAICLVVGIMPTAAFAANNDKAIQLGASNISGYDSTNGYDYIYYGEWDNSPIKWRVLDEQTNTQNEGLFLLSDVLLGTGTDGGVYFDNSGSDSNVWQNSTAQTWCKNFYSNNFSSKEQNAVLATTKSDSAYTSTYFGYAYGVSSLSGDKVFFLSAEEAENSAYGFTDDNARIANYGNSAGYWWLRSPYAYLANSAGLVSDTGDVYGDAYVSYDWAARPAFNLDLNSVLFISAAEGGKSASSMDSGLTAVNDYTGNEWKLTLLDETREFAVTEQTVSGKPGDTITLNYTGATTGTNEYISVIIADENGAQYYGRVAQPGGESGTATLSIPADLAPGSYTLNVFSEQYNGDYKTDYASAFAEVALTVEEAAAPGIDTGKAIQLVDSGTAANIGGGQADNIYFGTYQQSSDGSGGYNTDPIKWRVLENADGQLFLLSDQNLDVFQYHTEEEDVTWETSTMRSWLNGYSAEQNTGGSSGTDYTSDNFIGAAFSEKEQKAIAETEVVNDDNPTYGTEGGDNTNDKIFLLSIAEANNDSYFADNNSRIATNTAYVAGGGKIGGGMLGVGEADNWWLRSPGNDDDVAAYVNDNGGVRSFGPNVDFVITAVRPAFNLDLTSVLFTSAAVGGKIPAASSGGNQGGEAADAIFEIGDYDGNEWKLTLKDESRRFSANVNGRTNVSAQAGDSVQITYSGAETGDKEYVSVLLCDSSDTVLYYGNIAQNSESGTATVSLPSGLAAGDYKLEVFSEQCNGNYKTDYASSFQTINLKVPLSLETTPNAAFTAASDNGGVLSDVDVSMKYSVDGGSTWNGITDTTMAITGVTASNDVKVYKPGNGITTSDSAVQTIDVTQAEPPTGVLAVDCTTSEQNDGQITGVDSTMEYKLSTASVWTDVPGNSVTGLTNGAYEVRVKANGTALASTAVTVTIAAHTCVAEGDWQYDETNHWKRCSSDSCNAKVDEAAHSEGTTATCTAPAVCKDCSQPYGAKNPDNHTGAGAGWHSDAGSHWNTCECGETINKAEHTFKWVIDTEATATQAGSRHEECTVCGYAKEAEEIPATGVSETPGKPVVPEEKPDPSPAPSDTVTPSVPDEPAATVQTPLAASEVRQNTVRMDSKTVLNTGAKSLKVTWGKVSGAEGYDLYVAACGKRFNGITKSVAGTVKSATFKKLAGKKLKPQKSYKVKVRAYRMVNGRKEYIANGTTLHAALTGNKTYTNAGRVQVNRKNYTLKQGKKTAIRAVIVKQKQNRRLLTKGHGPTLSYMSSNSAVASVSKNGTITAKKKGRCTIYVRALNGVCKKVGVKVK